MAKDLDVIKDLETELGESIPRIEFDKLTYVPRIGFAVDEHNNIIGLGLDGERREGLIERKILNKKTFFLIIQLRNLIRLSLASNSIVSVPEDFVALDKLERIQLCGNKIEIVPSHLLKLPKLKHLGLSSNKIKELSRNVIDFDLDLVAKGITAKGITEDGICLDDNPLEIPPLEIFEQGIEAVRNYFNQIEQAKGQTQYLFEAKLLIIGDGGTGKTSFKRKIRNVAAKLPKDKDTTLGIEVDTWSYPIQFPQKPNLEEVQFHVNLWDFGGQKIYRGTHQIFFSDKSYYVLVADTREQGTDFSYWLNTVKQLGGDDSSVLILLNKKYGHEVKFDETGFRSHFGKIIKDVVELDLKNDKAKIINLQDIVKLHLRQLPGIGDPLPPSWVQIREELLKEKVHFITFDRFRQICSDYDITDPSVIRTLSGYFCRIGVFTHYIDDPLLQERIYLDSNWLVNTVYKVLDNKQVKVMKGRLEEKDIKDIWQTNELNFEIDKLTQLMHKFGLMYHIPGSKKYVVPEHLPTNQPYEEWEHKSASDILYFTYEFDKYMPNGLMSRLIVSLHRHIKNHDYVWNRGLNIELKGTHGEIIETYGSSNSFQIRIAGANKIELLAIIRERFAEVLEPFRNLNYKQQVPCTCNECSIASIPEFHDYNKLLNLRAKGTGSQCPKSGEIVEITDLLRITEFIKDEDEVMDDAEAPVSSDLKTIELFLASSKELKSDREQVEIWVNRENKKLVKKGFFLQLNLWEDFLDAMSKTRLQDEYNKMVEQSDIFISLFATQVGEFTKEEFEVAHSNFQEVQVNTSDLSIVEDLIRLKNFKEKLEKLGHFYTSYKSIEDLNRQLKNQLDKILENMS